MRSTTRLLLATALLLLPACEGVRVSDRDVQMIEPERMPAILEDPQTVIVDVRHPDAYGEGHIPGAVNIYLPRIAAHDPRLSSAQRIVVYGDGWTDPLSTAAWKKMRALGYRNLYEFKGGVEAWRESGRSLVTAVPEEQIRPETAPEG